MIGVQHAGLVLVERGESRVRPVDKVGLRDVALLVHVVIVEVGDFEEPVDFLKLCEFFARQFAVVIGIDVLEKRRRIGPPFIAGDLAIVIEVPGLSRADERALNGVA